MTWLAAFAVYIIGVPVTAVVCGRGGVDHDATLAASLLWPVCVPLVAVLAGVTGFVRWVWGLGGGS